MSGISDNQQKSGNKPTDTGENQAEDTRPRQPNGRLLPPVDTRFGGKRANKRNNNGRPRNVDTLRKLAQKVANQELPPNEKGQILTRIEAMLTLMSSSRNPADRKLFLEYTYGKVKDEVDLTSKGEQIGQAVTIYIPDNGRDDEKKPKTGV